MLILSRHLNEKIAIGDKIVVMGVEIQSGQLRLVFEVPPSVPVKRWTGRQSEYEEVKANQRSETGNAGFDWRDPKREQKGTRFEFGSRLVLRRQVIGDVPLEGVLVSEPVGDQANVADADCYNGIQIENGVTFAWLATNESVVIDEKIVATLIRVGRSSFILGFDAPKDLFIGRIEVVANQPSNDAEPNHTSSSDSEWARIRSAMSTSHKQQLHEWAGIDEFLITRYLAGTCTPKEVDRVEQGMTRSQWVRDCVALARDAAKAAKEIPVADEPSSMAVAMLDSLSPRRRKRLLRRLERELAEYVAEQQANQGDSEFTDAAIAQPSSEMSSTFESAPRELAELSVDNPPVVVPFDETRNQSQSNPLETLVAASVAIPLVESRNQRVEVPTEEVSNEVSKPSGIDRRQVSKQMLILARKANQSVVLSGFREGDVVTVTIVRLAPRVCLGFQFPKEHLAILREELVEERIASTAKTAKEGLIFGDFLRRGFDRVGIENVVLQRAEGESVVLSGFLDEDLARITTVEILGDKVRLRISVPKHVVVVTKRAQFRMIKRADVQTADQQDETNLDENVTRSHMPTLTATPNAATEPPS